MATSLRNEAAVLSLYDAEQRRDITAWEPLWSESGRHTFRFAAPVEPVVGLEALVEATKAKFAERPPYEIHVRTDRLADPTRILARLGLGEATASGRRVEIWCLFRFDADGLIVEIEEIGDTAPGPLA
nr:nuclear transport factor 2 family protein [Agromyces luteolus]